MAIIKMGKGDTKNTSLEQHETARKAARDRKSGKHHSNSNTTATTTATTTFKVTRIEDIISRLDAEKGRRDS